MTSERRSTKRDPLRQNEEEASDPISAFYQKGGAILYPLFPFSLHKIYVLGATFLKFHVW
jgi:hypothetical protein